MLLHDLPEEIIQVLHLDTQVHLVELRHRRVSVSDQDMVVIRLPMADRVPICDLFSVNLIQPFHAPLCFHGLGRENFKISDHSKLKFIFLPLSADKCPRLL